MIIKFVRLYKLARLLKDKLNLSQKKLVYLNFSITRTKKIAKIRLPLMIINTKK